MTDSSTRDRKMLFDQKLLTTREVCDYLRISSRTLRRYTREQSIPYIKLSNGLVRFSPTAITESLKEKEVRPITSVAE